MSEWITKWSNTGNPPGRFCQNVTIYELFSRQAYICLSLVFVYLTFDMQKISTSIESVPLPSLTILQWKLIPVFGICISDTRRMTVPKFLRKCPSPYHPSSAIRVLFQHDSKWPRFKIQRGHIPALKMLTFWVKCVLRFWVKIQTNNAIINGTTQGKELLSEINI